MCCAGLGGLLMLMIVACCHYFYAILSRIFFIYLFFLMIHSFGQTLQLSNVLTSDRWAMMEKSSFTCIILFLSVSDIYYYSWLLFYNHRDKKHFSS